MSFFIGSQALNDLYVSRNIGSGTGSIVLHEVECSGKETRLKDCRNSYATCFHTQDAGVRCRHKGKVVKFKYSEMVYKFDSE